MANVIALIEIITTMFIFGVTLLLTLISGESATITPKNPMGG